MSFIKDDKDKTKLSLVEPAFIVGLGDVLTFGAKKYGVNNWKNATKEDVNRYKDALLRHILAYLDGEKRDKETNLSHLYHATCNLMFLDYFERKGVKDSSSEQSKISRVSSCVASSVNSLRFGVKPAERIKSYFYKEHKEFKAKYDR